MQAISCGTLALLSSFLFEETRENVLLSRNATALNKWYDECEKVGMIGLAGGPGENLGKARQNLRWTVTDVYRKSSLANVIRISVSRPFCTSFLPCPLGLRSHVLIRPTCHGTYSLLVLALDSICLGSTLPFLRRYPHSLRRRLQF